MQVTLSKSAILGYARRAGLLGAARSDCAVEYTDGLDVEGALLDGIRSRYLALIDGGTREQLAPDDVAARVAVGDSLPGGGVRLTLPSGTRRIFDVALDGWSYAVEVLPAVEAPTVMSRQLNPFTRACAERPVAVLEAPSGGEIRSLMCWPGAAAARTLTAVVVSDNDRYVLDESAIPLILPSNLTDILLP